MSGDEGAPRGEPGEEGRWPKRYSVVLFCFAAVLIGYLDRINISVAVLAMEERFGWSPVAKGYVLGTFAIGYMVFQLPGGWFATRFGGRRILGFSVLWWSVFTLLTPFAAAASFPLLIASRIGLGLGEGAMFPAAYSLFGRWVPQAERSRAIAVLLSGIPAGTLVALSISGWLVVRFGWTSVFYAFGGLGVVWAWLWFRHIPEHPPAPADVGIDGPEAASVPWRRLLSSRAVWALIVNHFASNWGVYVIIGWLPSYFRDVQGLGIVDAGLFAVAPWLTMFVMVNLAATIADRWARQGIDLTRIRKLMQIAGLLTATMFLLLIDHLHGAASALVGMCGVMAGYALTFSGYGPNHLDLAPRFSGVLQGIANTTGQLPGFFAVATAGWLVQATGGYAAVFQLAAAINLVGALVWLLFASAKPVVD